MRRKFFLNGVCRHERPTGYTSGSFNFLNGVCRHEPGGAPLRRPQQFLNGVCRHEHEIKL